MEIGLPSEDRLAYLRFRIVAIVSEPKGGIYGLLLLLFLLLCSAFSSGKLSRNNKYRCDNKIICFHLLKCCYHLLKELEGFEVFLLVKITIHHRINRNMTALNKTVYY